MQICHTVCAQYVCVCNSILNNFAVFIVVLVMKKLNCEHVEWTNVPLFHFF